jgi:hypothetical protein
MLKGSTRPTPLEVVLSGLAPADQNIRGSSVRPRKRPVPEKGPKKAEKGPKNYQEPLLSRNLAVADFLGKIGKKHNVSVRRGGDRVDPASSGNHRGHC